MIRAARFRLRLELRPNAKIEILFLLGEAATTEEARQLIVRYRNQPVETSLSPVIDRWDDILGALNVRTPDRSLDIMLNRWLLYQTLPAGSGLDRPSTRRAGPMASVTSSRMSWH